MSTIARRLVSEREFLSLPESNTPLELVDGELVMSPSQSLWHLDRDAAPPLEQPPDLCIEVLSTNRVYDRATKRFIYAEAGVREYWMVDPAGVIERCSGPGLMRDEELSERLRSELLPGFELDIPALLA